MIDREHLDAIAPETNGHGRRELAEVVVSMQPVLYRRLERVAQANRMPIDQFITTTLLDALDAPVARYPEPSAPPREDRTPVLLRATLVATTAAIALGLLLVALALVLGW